MRIITKIVLILSIVSLLADVASEMLYPVVPVYLQQIGFSVFLIGLLEGLAEFIVGLSKGYFGKLSDDIGKRLPFVKWGYFLSALSKPMMAFFTYPLWIFFVRTIDRTGKGIRTAARDALLSQEATPQTKARVFGFHRSFDTIGAFLGPIIALTFLYFYPQQYKKLFLLAFIPGLLSVASIFLLKEKTLTPQPRNGNFFSYFNYWSIANVNYKKLVIGLILFTICNSSDVFLLLKAKQITGSDTGTIGAYIFYNFVYAISSYPMGILADKVGMKKTLISGVIFFAMAYAGFAFAKNSYQVFILFMLYGFYAAATEGIAKAWITNLTPIKQTATGIGLYTSLQSIGALIASVLAGAIWSGLGPAYVFAIASTTAFAISIWLAIQTKETT